MVRAITLLTPAILALLLAPITLAVAADRFHFYHENVLGTSMELEVRAESAEAAGSVEQLVLREIDRLDKVLSGYDPTSEFSRWQGDPRRPIRVSDELLDVLEACRHWRAASHGAFNPAVETLSRLWDNSVRIGRVPTAEELSVARAQAQAAQWYVNRAARTVQSATDCSMSLNALAKGYIVDRACDTAVQSDGGIRGLMLNLGGDLRVCGEMAVQVGVADPWRDSLTTAPMARIELRSKALATSGNSQRGHALNGQWFSHVIDPRSGLPADQVASASVVAARAIDADALATICCVLPAPESLALVQSLPGAECMIVGQDGQIAETAGWREMAQPPRSMLAVADQRPADASREPGDRKGDNAAAATWNADFELEVKFEINHPEGVRRYARPYVAVWVEDKQEFPVRTLVLWVWKSGPGPRWIPDLRRWYRADRLRQLADEEDLVDTMSAATHPPGKYRAIWDGKDDRGKLVSSGEYTVLIEAAREHGTYQVMSKKVTLGNEPFNEELKGNVEIKSATIDYRRKKPAR